MSGDMSGMDMGQDDMRAMAMPMNGALGPYAMSREASGTSWQPEAAPHAGIDLMQGDWMVMLHGRASLVADSQSGPRGDSQVFVPGMAMVMATRPLSQNDTLGLRAMVSLDPFMGRRGYPLLLANGETANGLTPLLDRQHPHDLFMELAATWSHRFSERSSFFFYGGYPGEPALGPSAYMHRISAMDSPETPISHHWLDSTHISFGVATVGLVLEDWKMEVSRFTGREPDQHRFNFDAARFDSTAARLSYNPNRNWSLQVSAGFLKSPELLMPSLNESRVTASATYFLPLADQGSFAATLAYGHKHLSDGIGEGAALLEAEYRPDAVWTLFARGESIESDELVPGPSSSSHPPVRGAGKVSLGAIHDWTLAEHFKAGLGGLYAFDVTPTSPTAPYGGGAHGAMAFIRLVAE